MLSCILICLWVAIRSVNASWPLPADFSNWIWQSGKAVPLNRLRLKSLSTETQYTETSIAVVAGKWLYIDGGAYYDTNSSYNLCKSSLPLYQLASLRSDNGNPSEYYLVHRLVSALDTFECERKRQWQASDDVTQ